VDSSNKQASTPSGSASNSGQNTRSNPVCLEVAVTIRSLPGDKGEASSGQAKPTREEARTVIVFDNGAVLRLAGDFLAGQAVIVSNPQGRDVVCRVVSARSLPTVKGYIEVEFVESANDFWGIHKTPGQTNVPNPPAAAQPQVVAQPPIVPSEPLPAPPAPPRAAPIAPEPIAAEPIAPTGNAPSFEDLAGLVRMSPPPTAQVKAPEPPSRIPASKNADESGHGPYEAARSHSPVSTPPHTADLVSLSASWESTEHPVRRASPSGDILGHGMFSSVQTSSTPSSTGSRGKTILIVVGAAVLLVGLGAGWFFLHQGSPVTATAPAPVTSQPSVLAPPVASVPEQTAHVQPAEEPALPLTPIVSPVTSVSTESAAATPTSAPQTTRRPANNVNAKQPDHAAPARPAIPDLKMSGPTAESRNVGRLVDGSIPVMADTAGPMMANPAGAMLPTVARAEMPPAPPVPVAASGSAAKAGREARLISSTRPAYPPLAKQSNVEGDVLVSAEIDENGKVTGAKALSGPMFLRQAAVDTIRQWKYEPALVNGKPAPTQVSVKIQFRLK
jgi:protein TonB